jgi:hypothetical protein
MPDTGEVAVMLCESIFHVLVEQKLIPKEVAVEAVEGVAELAREMALSRDDVGVRPAVPLVEMMAQSLALKEEPPTGGKLDA